MAKRLVSDQPTRALGEIGQVASLGQLPELAEKDYGRHPRTGNRRPERLTGPFKRHRLFPGEVFPDPRPGLIPGRRSHAPFDRRRGWGEAKA